MRTGHSIIDSYERVLQTRKELKKVRKKYGITDSMLLGSKELGAQLELDKRKYQGFWFCSYEWDSHEYKQAILNHHNALVTFTKESLCDKEEG